MKVLAAIVTHNRRELLARCIERVQAQSRPVDGVLVIDNASSDGTVEMLRSRGVPHVTQDNVGSAGGWNRAIEHALVHHFDAVWLMDDDGYPERSALEILVGHLRPGVACASSVVMREDGSGQFVFPFPLLDRQALPVVWARRRKLPTLAELQTYSPTGEYPFAHLFNGALLSMAAVRQVGNVNRDFFMFGDEVDYFFRLRTVGQVISVLGARHFHPDVSQRPYTRAKVYYYVKNTLVLHRRYFNAVGIRNLAAIAIVLIRTARRNGIWQALSFLIGPSASVFFGAIARGLQGKIGKDFNG